VRTPPNQESGASRNHGEKAMLVLTRRVGEVIVIDEQIRVVVAAVKGDRVRLAICAPATVRVDRQEVHERRSLESGSQRPGVEQVYSCDDKEDNQ
jgi:carbon storage regulator